VYTLGKIGDQKIVSLKVSKLRPLEDASEKYQQIITHLSGKWCSFLKNYTGIEIIFISNYFLRTGVDNQVLCNFVK